MEAFLHKIIVFPIRILSVAFPEHNEFLLCIISQAAVNSVKNHLIIIFCTDSRVDFSLLKSTVQPLIPILLIPKEEEMTLLSGISGTLYAVILLSMSAAFWLTASMTVLSVIKGIIGE